MAGISAGAKWMAQGGATLPQIIFCRNAFAFIPLMIYIHLTKGYGALRTRYPLKHMTRSAVGLGAMVCTFTAVAMLPLVQSATLGFTAPLFMTLLTPLLLREKVGWHRWTAVVAGFIGVLIAMRPLSIHTLSVGMLFGLAAALGAALAMATIRSMPKEETGSTIVFYFTLAGTLASLVAMPFAWKTPDLSMIWVMVGTGLLGGIGQLLLTAAARLAPLPVIAPFDYTQLIWASGLGYAFWGETPDGWTIVGAGVVAASGVYIVWRERRARMG
jgi:drug/metabolite transporter (DMT)-like permease